MSRIVFFVLSFLVGLNRLFAGGYDPSYVQKFSTRFAVKTYSRDYGLSYSMRPSKTAFLSTPDVNSIALTYRPYNPIIAGVGVNLWGVISLSHSFQFVQDLMNKTGKTESKIRDFSFGYNGRWFFTDLSLQTYKRLYYTIGKSTDKYQVYSATMSAVNFGANQFFAFNAKKFSYNAAFNQSAIQLKPAGSFFLMLQFNYNKIADDDKTGIIPTTVLSNYASVYGGNLVSNKQFIYSILPGYAYNFVYKKFYAAGALFLGGGSQVQRYKTLINNKIDGGVALLTRAKVSIGLNGPRVFCGVYGNLEYQSTTLKDMAVLQNLYNYGIFAGFRIVKLGKKKK